jgi:hypothetical protein
MTPPEPSATPRMDRRTALKWLATAMATTGCGWHSAAGAEVRPSPAARGYGTDPDLTKAYQPGEVWPLVMTAAQRATAAALCDAIIPADGHGPSASAVRVPDFIDEWISAPYPGHDDDRRLVTEGLAWFEAESQRRFQRSFASLEAPQRDALCDDVCHLPDARPAFAAAARFFQRFRDLTAGGYYSTPEGMTDLGYTGNVALDKFEGPPPEVLQKLGLGRD